MGPILHAVYADTSSAFVDEVSSPAPDGSGSEDGGEDAETEGEDVETEGDDGETADGLSSTLEAEYADDGEAIDFDHDDGSLEGGIDPDADADGVSAMDEGQLALGADEQDADEGFGEESADGDMEDEDLCEDV